MKATFILCLALVLNGGFSGCSSNPKHADLSADWIAQIYNLDVEKPSHKDRVKLAHDFPKLTPQNQYAVLAFDWQKARCPEFADVLLPFARMPKESEDGRAETFCDEVFICLLDLRPALVRPIILEDLQRDKPLFSLIVLRALRDKELPELDDVLLAHLNNPQDDIWKIAPIIERYATARILPQVIAFYQTKAERGWACSLQTAFLRYWLKHDRPGALQAIEKAVNFRKSTRCYTRVLGETLCDSFAADAEKLARKFINDSDPDVAKNADYLLAHHKAKETLTN